MRRSRLMTVFMALILVVIMIMPVQADEISEQQELLQRINQQMDQQQNNLDSAAKTEKTIMGQMWGIEKQTALTQKDLKTLDDKIDYLQSNINANEQQIKTLQKKLDKQTALLGERLVVIYEQGDSSYLEVLLGANDLKDLITRYDMLKTIIDQDRELIDTINRNKKELDNKKADLEVQKRELEADQAAQESKQLLLAGQLKDKKSLLDSVQNEKEKYAQAIAELEQASAEAEAMIRRLQGKGDSIGTGTFTWPTPGYRNITSPYGMRFHPILKVNKLHTGIDIGAPHSAKIVAADGGKVIFSGWLGAYGNAIVIDHGGGMSSLYGHAFELLVNEGDTVVKGQLIGRVGSTGWSTGPHLHFEIRKNGTPVNPGGYI